MNVFISFRKNALEKLEAIIEFVGYPSHILNDFEMDNMIHLYQNVCSRQIAEKNTY